MWINSKVFKEDLEMFSNATYIDWDKLKNKTVFVTGATGLIGYTTVSGLIYASRKKELNIKIIALVRNIENAQDKFKEQLDSGNELEFVIGTVENFDASELGIDYIIHGASLTSSSDFVNKPVETITIAIKGTQNMLELAKRNNVHGMVYMSSMEVYGNPSKGYIVTENEIGAFKPQVIRNSYPISKMECESLCASYASEYDVPVSVARLTQTFGPGVDKKDKRIFAQMANSVKEHKNIVLKTKGETEHCYLYTMDAATALVHLMQIGQKGEAYTVANKSTYYSIADMASLVAKMGGISVDYDIQDISKLGYASTKYINLDTSKLENTGWKATTSLEDMYKRMMEEM